MNTSTQNFPNYNNVFNNTSGTARHFGTTNAHLAASKFHTLTDQTPEYPQTFDFPNIPGATPDFWFEDDGIGGVTCVNCYVPPAVPDGRGRQIDAADLIVAGQGFDYNAPGLQALQWESSRDLYHRMRNYTELSGKSGLLDAFYTNGGSAKIGNFYIADSLVADLSNIVPATGAVMEGAIQQIMQTAEEVSTLLGGLLQY